MTVEWAQPPEEGSRRKRQTDMQRGRRWARRRQAAVEDAEIIMWDGEGLGHHDHRYVLLAARIDVPGEEPQKLVLRGNDEHWSERPSRRLDTVEILDLVWRCGMAHPSAYQVMFGANYDWNNWLWRANMDTARWLHEGRPVKLGPYTAKFNGLWFEVSRNGRRTIVWDVWKFWGQGFADALEDAFPDFHGLPTIKAFKALRGGFTEDMMPDVEEYNDLELEGGCMLVRRLFKDLADAGIRRPSYLTGAGAVAGSILGQLGVADHNEQPPPEVMDALLRAFSAGRIEPLKCGTREGPFLLHDIRSAYPDAMATLPSMKGGSWEWSDGDEVPEDWDRRMSVWHLEWDWTGAGPKPPTRRFYPFFFREEGGAVHYPPAGEGWYMWPEVVTARALGWDFKVHGGWVFKPATEELPMRKLPGLFRHRRWLKEQGLEGAQRIMKYGLNAVYGKTCQARGSTPDKPPRFQNFAWSAWTTSHCRAKVLEAMSQDPDAVVAVMTDSVAATHRLDLPEGGELGQWEVKEYERAQVVQAGVGTLWSREPEEGHECTGSCMPERGLHAAVTKYRGFDRGTVSAAAVEQQWRENARARERLPVVTSTWRPITLGSALASEERFRMWNTWQETPRELDVYGGDGKRTLQREVHDIRPWRELVDLEPFGSLGLGELRRLGISQSAPYEPRWADADAINSVEMDGVLGPFPDRELDAELEAAAHS